MFSFEPPAVSVLSDPTNADAARPDHGVPGDYRSKNPARRGLSIGMAWGVVGGAIGFCLGFFGPILLSPQSNQGPLLGIFFTGPIGFVIGIIAGWIREAMLAKRR